jgi:hypothetical protein
VSLYRSLLFCRHLNLRRTVSLVTAHNVDRQVEIVCGFRGPATLLPALFAAHFLSGCVCRARSATERDRRTNHIRLLASTTFAKVKAALAMSNLVYSTSLPKTFGSEALF